jgi:hypothetical protein
MAAMLSPPRDNITGTLDGRDVTPWMAAWQDPL